MNDIRIEFHPDFSASPAAHLAEPYEEEIRSRGFSQGGVGDMFNRLSWCSVAMDGSECVGFSAFFPLPSANALWVDAAYVLPEYRGRGIHAMLFSDVVRQARLEGVSSVQSGVHKDNANSLKSHQKQGREIFGYFTRYVLN